MLYSIARMIVYKEEGTCKNFPQDFCYDLAVKKRPLLIAANWKMYAAPKSLKNYQSLKNIEVLVFPNFLDLRVCLDAEIVTGGQFGRPEKEGAFTGDVSSAMLKTLGCTHLLCGHSDRRQFHHETNEFVAAQAKAALAHGLHPVICIGERGEERDAGRGKSVIEDQMKAVITVIGDADVTYAYEPVWAISRGDSNRPAATANDAQEMHGFIRSLLPKSTREKTRILYGGSMKPENCEELLTLPDIDGGLVGGASLDPSKFQTILEVASRL